MLPKRDDLFRPGIVQNEQVGSRAAGMDNARRRKVAAPDCQEADQLLSDVRKTPLSGRRGKERE